MNTLSAQNIFSSMTIIQFPVFNPFPVFKRRKKNMEKSLALKHNYTYSLKRSD